MGWEGLNAGAGLVCVLLLEGMNLLREDSKSDCGRFIDVLTGGRFSTLAVLLIASSLMHGKLRYGMAWIVHRSCIRFIIVSSFGALWLK